MTIPKRPQVLNGGVGTTFDDTKAWMSLEAYEHVEAVAKRAVEALRALIGECVKCDLCREQYTHASDCIAGQAMNDIEVSGWKP